MKKIYENVLLVTGGAGFIGSAFLRLLVPKYPNWYFINLDALTYAGDLKKVKDIEKHDNYTFVRGNICDIKLINKLFIDFEINIVVNFAAESHVDKSIMDAESFIQTNIFGTYTLLEVVRKNWGIDDKLIAKKYRFLQISTDEVYGSLKLEDESWIETDCLSPRSPYSASKASAELICMSYWNTFGIPILISRSSNNFGPYQNLEKFIPTIISSLNESRVIPIYGTGENVRDWIFVEDNVDCLELLILDGIPGNIYNIGAGREYTNIEIARLIIGLHPMKKSTIAFVDDRKGHDFRYSVNTEKILKLGWQGSKKDFLSYLVETIKYYYNGVIRYEV